MFYGRGAGGDPTATAVVGDLVRVARNLAFGGARDRMHLRARPPDPARWTTRTASTT